jgi:hypothetical protein
MILTPSFLPSLVNPFTAHSKFEYRFPTVERLEFAIAGDDSYLPSITSSLPPPSPYLMFDKPGIQLIPKGL